MLRDSEVGRIAADRSSGGEPHAREASVDYDRNRFPYSIVWQVRPHGSLLPLPPSSRQL